MKKSSLEQAITNLDDRHVREAMEEVVKGQKQADQKVVARELSEQKTTGRKVSKRRIRRLGSIAACLALAAILSGAGLTGAVAAGNITAYELLYRLYPKIALELTPVSAACESNGIRMEVEAVHVKDASAEIYISMQDLEGDRIDGTVDLFDSYRIQTAADQNCTCSLVSYDEEEKKATFLIGMEYREGQRIEGEKLRFFVSKFLSKKTETDQELPEIMLEQVPQEPKIQSDIPERGWSAMMDTGFSLEELGGFLVPQEDQSFSPVEGVTVTGYGFVGDHLHVQVHYENIMTYDDHGSVYLKDTEGERLECTASVSFWDEDQVGAYEEYIFDISSREELEGFSAWGEFVTCRTVTEGDWQVTIPIENVE